MSKINWENQDWNLGNVEIQKVLADKGIKTTRQTVSNWRKKLNMTPSPNGHGGKRAGAGNKTTRTVIINDVPKDKVRKWNEALRKDGTDFETFAIESMDTRAKVILKTDPQ